MRNHLGLCLRYRHDLSESQRLFLEEYQRKIATYVIHRWFELLISNLAGVPSIVYGLVGLTVFVYMFGLLGTVNRPNFEIGSSYYHQYLSLRKDPPHSCGIQRVDSAETRFRHECPHGRRPDRQAQCARVGTSSPQGSGAPSKIVETEFKKQRDKGKILVLHAASVGLLGFGRLTYSDASGAARGHHLVTGGLEPSPPPS